MPAVKYKALTEGRVEGKMVKQHEAGLNVAHYHYYLAGSHHYDRVPAAVHCSLLGIKNRLTALLIKKSNDEL